MGSVDGLLLQMRCDWLKCCDGNLSIWSTLFNRSPGSIDTFLLVAWQSCILVTDESRLSRNEVPKWLKCHSFHNASRHWRTGIFAERSIHKINLIWRITCSRICSQQLRWNGVKLRKNHERERENVWKCRNGNIRRMKWHPSCLQIELITVEVVSRFVCDKVWKEDDKAFQLFLSLLLLSLLCCCKAAF